MLKHYKIVIFSPGLNIGGIEKVFLNYASLLSETENEVLFLTCHEYSDLINLIPKRVKYINLRTNKLSRSLFQIIKFLRQESPDFILTANAVAFIVLLAKYLAFSSVRIIASHHNYINQEIHSFRDRFLLFKIYNLCWKIIAVSTGIKKHLLKHGVISRKIEVITNPINTKEIDYKIKEKMIVTQSPYIVFVGRLSIVKNLCFLLRSFKYVLPRINHARLVIVGEGVERIKIEEEILRLGLHEQVILTGMLENPYPILSKASLVVLPSYSEAFPTVLLESLYLGRTVVSTPTLGALEILRDGKLGYISKSFDDVVEFSNLLIKGLDSPFDPLFLRKEFELLYSPKKTVNKILQLFDM